MSVFNRLSAELKGDRVIWAIVALLAFASVMLVYSSSSTLAFTRRSGSTSFYLMKHLSMLILGLVVTYVFHLVNYKRFKKWAPAMLLGVIILLIITLIFGPEINDARRWIVVPGIGISFQTSDLAKIAIITYVASKLTDTQEYIRSFSEAFMPIIVPIMVVCALIGIADLSTGAVIFVTCLLMMFIGRVAFKYIFLLCFSALVTFALLILIDRATDLGRVDTWISRINSFLSNPDGETQTQLAKMAIAEGGLFGNGPGNSIQKNHLPMAWTDYIYAVSIEEYGLVGAFVLMGLFLLLFFRVVRMVTIGSKTFGAMLAMGLALILVMQALANMAVSVHLVPVMGLPMPMVSMGGTSLLFSCAALGMILSVSKNIEEEKNLSL
jgi:cell division protein FtsW